MSVISSPSLVVTQLQTRAELDKAALARRIHDELGGCLLAATMDLSVLEKRTPAPDESSVRRFERITQLLHAAIDLTRAVTEDLHPTLLDNVGLFTALRREMKSMCVRSNMHCLDHFPEIEPKLSSAAGIALFRIGQEMLFVAEGQSHARVVDFHITADDMYLRLHISVDVPLVQPREDSRGGEALACTQHRVRSLGGTTHITARGDGTMALIVEVPLANTRAQPAANG